VVKIMMSNFLNVPDVVQLSLAKLVAVASMFFLFRYLNYLIKALYHKYHKSKIVVNGRPNFTLANNIIAILVWGSYFIISIKLLKIPSTAISVISAGLATGVGFAMKDLLENFFYGISLMTGRVRVGDFIECDGIRGKVDSITYQSTQIVTADGCIIAFLNSSLFSKNFKNITKNHSYEMVQVPVGVAYGSNVNEVRKMLIEAVDALKQKQADGRDIISTKKPIDVVFSDFGDNSVNLILTYWVLVEQKFGMTGKVKEVIYNTLNAHNIEIPFPQRDLHIRTVDTAIPVATK
jgi:potassium-dependent mechanosensitive channel